MPILIISDPETSYILWRISLTYFIFTNRSRGWGNRNNITREIFVHENNTLELLNSVDNGSGWIVIITSRTYWWLLEHRIEVRPSTFRYLTYYDKFFNGIVNLRRVRSGFPVVNNCLRMDETQLVRFNEINKKKYFCSMLFNR